MIFFKRDWGGQSWAEANRAAQSLGLFAGHPADSEALGSDFFAELPAPRAPQRRGWRVPRSPSGFPVLLHGWVDNVRELATELEVSDSNAASVYGAAVERWGVDADRRVIGAYAAIVCLPDGTVRLSRSPWSSKPLFYVAQPEVLLASSIPRPLFAAGMPKQLRPGAVDAMLCLELPDPRLSMFEGVATVEQGAVTIIDRDQVRTTRWYDPVALAPVRFARDQDYVDAGNALLADAVRHALRPAKKPGIYLSGGLDSPVVCDEVLRQLPPGQRLPSFTFVPLAEWDGTVAPHKFGSDQPYVEEFARMHPALDPVFVDNRGIDFDDRADALFTACDAGYPARVLASVYNGPGDAARAHGCDWVLNADSGNLTFSNGAPWAAPEFLRTGRWLKLWRLMANQRYDDRPMWRRIASRAALPLLPSALQARVRGAFHPERDSDVFANPYLSDQGRLADFRNEASTANNIATADAAGSRERYIANNYHAAGLGGEMSLGGEQVWGMLDRDVTAYRPLIEFCCAIPTDQFVRDGEDRWLGRRMAIGRLPERQRTNHLYGEHNVDWHARRTPRLAELRSQVEAIGRHPVLASVIDADRALADIDNWPETTPRDPLAASRLRFHLPVVLFVARYVDAMTGRNQS
jgi:asparagine synthase (glutamine-hydrolysing)